VLGDQCRIHDRDEGYEDVKTSFPELECLLHGSLRRSSLLVSDFRDVDHSKSVLLNKVCSGVVDPLHGDVAVCSGCFMEFERMITVTFNKGQEKEF